MKRAIAKKAACGLVLTVPTALIGLFVIHAVGVFFLRYFASENLTAYRTARNSLALCSNGAVVMDNGLAAKCAADKVWLDEWYPVIMVRQTIAHHGEEAHWISQTLMAMTQNVLVLAVVIVAAGWLMHRTMNKGVDQLSAAQHMYQEMRMASQQMLLHAVTGAQTHHNSIDLHPAPQQRYQPYHPPPAALMPPVQAPSFSPFVAFSDGDPWRDVSLLAGPVEVKQQHQQQPQPQQQRWRPAP